MYENLFCLHKFLGRSFVRALLSIAYSLLMPQVAGLTANATAIVRARSHVAQQHSLPQGQAIERKLNAGETKTEVVSLHQGEFLRVLVEQRDINLRVTLRRAGITLLTVDLHSEEGTEPLSYEAAETGDYQLEVQALMAQAVSGHYSVKTLIKPRPDIEDGLRLMAERLLIKAEQLRLSGGATGLRQALKANKESLTYWQRLNDAYWHAYALNAIANLHFDLGEREAAQDFYQEAVPLLRAILNRRAEAVTLRNIGYIYELRGEHQKASGYYEQSLLLSCELSDLKGQVEILSRQGYAQKGLGEWQKALDYFQQALQISRTRGNPLWEANTLTEIGLIYYALREKQKSLDSHNTALRLYQAARNYEGEADTLNNLGLLYANNGEHRTALEFYDRALSVYKNINDPADEARTLLSAGHAAYMLNEQRKALNYYLRAASHYKTLGDARGEGDSLSSIGWWHLQSSDKRQALKYYNRALRLHRRAGDRVGEARTLNNIGRFYDELRQADKASKYYEQTLTLSQSVGDSRGEAVTLTDIGVAHSGAGNKRKANEYYERALPLWRIAGDKTAEAITLTNLADNYSEARESQKALDFYQQALTLHRLLKDRAGEAKTLDKIARIYLSLGDKQKAIEHYEHNLRLQKVSGNRRDEALTLGRIGDVYYDLSDYQKELETRLLALSLWRALTDRTHEASTLNDIGDTYLNLAEHQKALESQRRALSIWHELKNDWRKAQTLHKLGGIYFDLDDKRKALEYFTQVLPLHISTGNHTGEVEILSQIALCYYFLGERDLAWEYFGKTLPLFKYRAVRLQKLELVINAPLLTLMYGDQKRLFDYYTRVASVGRDLGDHRINGLVLTKIGALQLTFGEEAQAIRQLRRALKAYRMVGERNGEAEVLNEIGNFYLNRKPDFSSLRQRPGIKNTRTPNETVALAEALIDEDYEQANKFFQQALLHYQAVKNKRGEAKTLVNIGALHHIRDNNMEALKYCQKALWLLKENPDREIEWSAHYRLMKISEDLPSPELAIVFGKQTINLLQSVRLQLGKLDRGMGQAFARLTTDPYRELATILIAQGRLLEAEQVLEMLKEEEFFRFIRRDDKVARDLLTRINLSPAERTALERYDQIAEDIIRLGVEYANLEVERKKLPEERTTAIIARQVEINNKLAVARTVLEIFLDELKKEFNDQDKRIAAVEDGLQAEVKSWKEPRTVVISTIVGQDSLSMILTTHEISRPYIIDKIGNEKFSKQRLDALITEFRLATKTPNLDPRPMGQKLYNLLIKPLEKDLQVVGADTLVWSLDANLRYVPVAALYDAQHGYLAERYANVLLARASQSNLSQPPVDKNKWQALGLGVSKSVEGFMPLKNVPEELLAIVRDREQHDTAGLLEGRRLLDENFTMASFRRSLGRYKVIHAATHFSFIPGTRDESLESFLLLGSGEKLTLGQVKGEGAMFDGVELLVLSACETAAGGKGADGREIEGFGALAQKAGARTVVATLWPVADASTRELMVKFYLLQGAPSNYSKAAALQRAQTALLRGEITGTAEHVHNSRADLIGRQSGNLSGLPFPHDSRKPYAHPFYWAPFILIGNWK